MHIQSELISIALIVFAAFICGLISTRLKLPSIIGYIFAGIALKPSGLGLATDRGDISVVAELGVLLLLYSIGMQLSLRGFRDIWKTAVGAAVLQIIGFVGLMLGVGPLFGWSPAVSILFGFVLALSSTVVVLRLMEDMNLLRTQVGQIAVSVLIAQDLAVVPMILSIQLLAGDKVNFPRSRPDQNTSEVPSTADLY